MTAERKQQIQDYQAVVSRITGFIRFERKYEHASLIDVDNAMKAFAAKRHSIIEGDDETA